MAGQKELVKKWSFTVHGYTREKTKWRLVFYIMSDLPTTEWGLYITTFHPCTKIVSTSRCTSITELYNKLTEELDNL